VEIVEIQSDEVEHDKQPRLTGALRGLDPRVVIPPTEPSVEIENEDGANAVEGAQSAPHVTRQSRNGKSEANYDMKVQIRPTKPRIRHPLMLSLM
jgi:hypothetical protein